MKRFLISISLGVFLILLAIGGGYAFWRLFLVKPGPSAAKIIFEIKSGEPASQVGRNLVASGLLQDNFDYWLFRWYVSWTGAAQKLQAGIFEIQPGQSVRDLTNYLTDPQWAERELKFIEGWDLRDYGEYLTKEGVGQANDFYALVGEPAKDYRFSQGVPPKNFSRDYDFLADKPAYISLEGYLFPDTYRVSKTADLETVARRLLNNFGKKLKPDWRAEIRRQGKSIFDIVTMASIIEKEARAAADRKIVSDILWRRLSIGMPLQVDSSVNYLTNQSRPAVSLVETKIDSPYNTYKFSGLPFGPIANPGLASLQAAIYPEHNDYWFFLADKDGVIHYAKTLDEHNRNKVRYLR